MVNNRGKRMLRKKGGKNEEENATHMQCTNYLFLFRLHRVVCLFCWCALHRSHSRIRLYSNGMCSNESLSLFVSLLLYWFFLLLIHCSVLFGACNCLSVALSLTNSRFGSFFSQFIKRLNLTLGYNEFI